MLLRYDQAAQVRRVLRITLPGLLAAALLPAALWATPLDFGAALQDFETGEEVGTVEASGATMTVFCENEGGGPDLCIIFDTEEPSGGDWDLGAPNQDFGGPGLGEGGQTGKEGQNENVLGNILIIAENDEDVNEDGFVDVPDDESGGGVVRLQFSHAGRLSLTLIDVDEDEDEPKLVLWKEGEIVETVEGESPGDNGVQHLDLGWAGDIDAVDIELDGSTGIAEIVLDVISVGVAQSQWSNMKRVYR